jgi:thioesterase domain-containing protein
MSTSAKLFGIRFNRLFSTSWIKPLSLKKIAAEAASTILKQKKCDEINLIGFSNAGLLAFETARALSEQGYEIKSLILIDIKPYVSKPKWPLAFRQLAGLAKSFSRRVRNKSNWRESKSFAHGYLQYQLADRRITPVSITRPIIFPTELGGITDNELNQWRSIIGDNLEVFPIKGDHHSLRQSEVALDIAQAILQKH